MLEEKKQEKIQCDILIRDCSALVEGMQIKEHLAIAIKDGKILDILPQAQAGKYEAQEIITEQDKLWLPGLVDAHMHTGQQLLKGRVLDELPMIWTRIMLPFESTMTAAKMRLSAQVAALELIASGTTGFVDAGSYYMEEAGRVFTKCMSNCPLTQAGRTAPSLKFGVSPPSSSPPPGWMIIGFLGSFSTQKQVRVVQRANAPIR